MIALIEDPRAFGLQLRLIDRFGDNGTIAIVIGRMQANEELLIDTWLMSCRVLGRGVEEATLEVVVRQARQLGGVRLVGEYFPTKKNGMVKDHYAKLGFVMVEALADGGSRSILTAKQSHQRLADPLGVRLSHPQVKRQRQHGGRETCSLGASPLGVGVHAVVGVVAIMHARKDISTVQSQQYLVAIADGDLIQMAR